MMLPADDLRQGDREGRSRRWRRSPSGASGIREGQAEGPRGPDLKDADIRTGSGHRSGRAGSEAFPGGVPGAEQTGGLVPVRRSHRRGKDRARPAARRHPRSADASFRHERVSGEAHREPAHRIASGLCRLRRGRAADRLRSAGLLMPYCFSTRSRRRTRTSSTSCCR